MAIQALDKLEEIRAKLKNEFRYYFMENKPLKYHGPDLPSLYPSLYGYFFNTNNSKAYEKPIILTCICCLDCMLKNKKAMIVCFCSFFLSFFLIFYFYLESYFRATFLESKCLLKKYDL